MLLYLFNFLIKQKIESAWMEPKNIPDNLECHLKILVNSRGRILDISLQKSSGNLRFDNSALRAVGELKHLIFTKRWIKKFMKICLKVFYLGLIQNEVVFKVFAYHLNCSNQSRCTDGN